MKKIAFYLMITLSLAATSSLFAQNGNGDQRERMQQMYRQQLKDSLQLSDVMIDSVMAVRTEFQPQQREIFMDQNMTMEQKQAKMDEMKPAMKERYKSIGLTDDQIDKLEMMNQRMRDRMRNRMNNGGGSQQ